MRILASISEEQHPPIFISLAKAMPSADFRFIGFEWALGKTLIKHGHDYRHMHFWRKTSSTVTLSDLPVTQFRRRGLFEATPPVSVCSVIESFRDFVEDEIKSFRPDIVVVPNINIAACYLLMSVAKSMGIPVVSLHASFAKGRYIVSNNTTNWNEYLRALPLTGHGDARALNIKMRSDARFSDSREEPDPWLKVLIRSERLVRLMPGMNTVDSWKTIVSAFILMLYRPKWFSQIKTLHGLREVQKSFLLVVLHQPILENPSPDWKELLVFAARCTPDNLPIVIRPHPAEISPIRMPTEVLNALKGRPVFISRNSVGPNLKALYEHCRAVLTISSAVGVEALLHGKQVYTISPAYYSRPGCAEFVDTRDYDRVKSRLASDSIPSPDARIVQQFINLIVSEHTVSNPANDAEGAKELARQIIDAVEKHRQSA